MQLKRKGEEEKNRPCEHNAEEGAYQGQGRAMIRFSHRQVRRDSCQRSGLFTSKLARSFEATHATSIQEGR
jgi:hypothetical protein